MLKVSKALWAMILFGLVASVGLTACGDDDTPADDAGMDASVAS